MNLSKIRAAIFDTSGLLFLQDEYRAQTKGESQMSIEKKYAVIFDIDGTLSDCGHRKHYIEASKKDWKSFFYRDLVLKDLVIKNVRFFLELILTHTRVNYHKPVYIFLVTGRDEKHREVTEKWLSTNNIYYHDLLMRKNGDKREDFKVKKELYKTRIEPVYNVISVFEDRTQCVKMWRELGLTCFQVADGDF